MSSSNEKLVKTIPIHLIPLRKEQSVTDCSLSNEDVFGEKVSNDEKRDLLVSAESEANALKTKILEEAQKEKESLIQETLNEMDKLKKTARAEARQDGYKKGYAEGEQDAKRDYETRLTSLIEEKEMQHSSFVKEVQQSLDADRKFVSSNIVDIVEASIKKLLREVDTNLAKRVSKIVEEQADTLMRCQMISIRVSPQKIEEVKQACEEMELNDGKRILRITPDSLLGDLDCIIETEKEKIEFILESEMKFLIEEIERVSH